MNQKAAELLWRIQDSETQARLLLQIMTPKDAIRFLKRKGKIVVLEEVK